MTATKSDRVTDMAGARLLVVAFVAVAVALVVVVATHVKQATSSNWPTTTTATTTSNKFGAIASRSREK